MWNSTYPFEVVILIDLSNKVCILNKGEDLHLSVLNMITTINKSKTLTKVDVM